MGGILTHLAFESLAVGGSSVIKLGIDHGGNEPLSPLALRDLTPLETWEPTRPNFFAVRAVRCDAMHLGIITRTA